MYMAEFISLADLNNLVSKKLSDHSVIIPKDLRCVLGNMLSYMGQQSEAMPGNFFAQGGNKFDSIAILGTSDPYDVQLIRDGVNKVSLESARVLFKDSVVLNTFPAYSSGGASIVIRNSLSGRLESATLSDIGATPGTGGTGYIWNGIIPQTANFNITGNGVMGKIGLGVTPSTYMMDINTNLALLGSDFITDGLRSPSSYKAFRIGVPHYNQTTPSIALQAINTDLNNELRIGGGTSAGYAATVIQFYTGANITTLTGTLRGSIVSSGNWVIGTGSDNGNLMQVYGNLYSSGQVRSAAGFNTTGTTGSIAYTATLANNNELGYRIVGTIAGNMYHTYSNASAGGTVYMHSANANATGDNALSLNAVNGRVYSSYNNVDGSTLNRWFAGMDNSAGGYMYKVGYGTSTTPFGTVALAIATTGSVMIGSTTNNGARLQVAGTSTFANNLTMNFGTTNRTTRITDSSIGFSRVSDGGYSAVIGNDNGNIMVLSGRSGVDFITNSASLTGSPMVRFRESGQSYNSGYIEFSPQVPINSPLQASAPKIIDIIPTLNITDSLARTLIGVNYAPTVTSLTNTNHVAFRNTVGDNKFNTTSGNFGIGYSLAASLTNKLAVNGTARVELDLYQTSSNAYVSGGLKVIVRNQVTGRYEEAAPSDLQTALGYLTSLTGMSGTAVDASISGVYNNLSINFLNTSRVNWTNGQLLHSGNVSVDWYNRRLTDSAGTIAADFDIGFKARLRRVQKNDADHSLGINDVILEYTNITTNRTVSIDPTILPQGVLYTIKDRSNSAGVSGSIILSPTSGTIDGNSDVAINVPMGSVTFYSDGSDLAIVYANV